MRKICVLVCALIIFCSVNPLSINASPELTPDCRKQLDDRMDDFTELIMKDVISSFDLDISTDPHIRNYMEVTLDDLHASHMIYGGKIDDQHYNSLLQHFMGSFHGEPRLFIKLPEAYVLYQEQDNLNVIIHLNLKGNKWEVVERKKKKGNEVKLPPLKCHQEYLKEKRKNSH